jgi:NADH-quinone oxidoreductase subunit D
MTPTTTPRHGAMFDTDELVINMGPQHPSTHGVLRVVLRLDGERVVDADVVIGYLHRGIEKLCENRDWGQIVLLTDRMDYVAAATNNLGYCETVEKMLSLEVPRRARYIRTILSELQRVASHLVWLGTHAMDIGAVTVFLYCLRERELILDLFEEYCGARLTYNCMRVGGLPQDLPPGWDRKVRAICDIVDEKVLEYETLLTQNRIWLERTRNVGVISGADAIAIGLSGPPLRASGVFRDVRKDEPYAAYDELPFDVPLGSIGDTYDRYLVRLEEFRQSNRIIRQALDGLPEGPIVGKVPRLIKPPAGETYHAIESPKGELGFFIASDGKSLSPYRFRVRPPSFCNLQALPQLCRGHLVADVVALIGTIDIVLGEVDR